MSFYGFTDEQSKATFERWGRVMSDEEYKLQLAQNRVRIIREAGGSVPSEEDLMKVPSFSNTVKEPPNTMIQEYWNRIGMVAEFVTKSLPAESDITNLPVSCP